MILSTKALFLVSLLVSSVVRMLGSVVSLESVSMSFISALMGFKTATFGLADADRSFFKVETTLVISGSVSLPVSV